MAASTPLRRGRRWTGYAIAAMGLVVACGQCLEMLPR